MRPGESGAPGLSSRRAETNRDFPLPARLFAAIPGGAPDWIDDVDLFRIPDSFHVDSALRLWTNRS
jgi:hypothetical protein